MILGTSRNLLYEISCIAPLRHTGMDLSQILLLRVPLIQILLLRVPLIHILLVRVPLIQILLVRVPLIQIFFPLSSLGNETQGKFANYSGC